MIHLIYIYFTLNAVLTGIWVTDGTIKAKYSPIALLFGMTYILSVLSYILTITLIKIIGNKTGLEWIYVYYFDPHWKNKRKYIGNKRMIAKNRSYINPISKHYSKKIIMWHFKYRNI